MTGDKVYYFDSSAFIKRYLQEEGSEQVKSLFSEPPLAASTVLMCVEIRAAPRRAVEEGRLNDEEAAEAWKSFRAEWEHLERVEIDEALLERAIEVAWNYGLRANDAVHLAPALRLCERQKVPVVMVTYDLELWEAARANGMEVFPQSRPSLKPGGG
ncbi:MAG: type II toxin-antitoxin system VapC family toxin [Candidatus Kapabacteria bacterium]|nr:type II toxin-antitoxin system VapC family toxin [Candidatus Kapabacteria bacterium]MDW8012019.1 type II toxin-antitoxin system VapC family toxin [Bacteroidota bacterium]